MIRGLEARHLWTPPGAEEAALTLNERVDDEGTPTFPHYSLEEIGGLMGLGDVEEANDPKVGEDGENPRLARRRGKSVSYAGLVRARSLDDLREAEADLRAAFEDVSAEGRMDVVLHPLHPKYETELAKFYLARALGLECGDIQGEPTVTTFGFERGFVVGLRMSDPHYFDAEGGEYA
jgi:hypothetical protein